MRDDRTGVSTEDARRDAADPQRIWQSLLGGETFADLSFENDSAASLPVVAASPAPAEDTPPTRRSLRRREARAQAEAQARLEAPSAPRGAAPVVVPLPVDEWPPAPEWPPVLDDDIPEVPVAMPSDAPASVVTVSLPFGPGAPSAPAPAPEAPSVPVPEAPVVEAHADVAPVIPEPVEEEDPLAWLDKFVSAPAREAAPLLADGAPGSADASIPAEPAEPATPREKAIALAGRLGLAYVDLTEFSVDPTVVGLIPGPFARSHSVLAVSRAGERIVVVVADPENVIVLDDVAAIVRSAVVPVVAEAEAIIAAIDRYHRVDSELEELTSAFEGPDQEDIHTPDVGDAVVDEAPIIRFVNLIISQAITDRASDIHIEPEREDLRVRYRIDGVLTTVQRVPRSMIAGVISRLKVMAELDIGERRRPQDGRISVSHAGRNVDLRVATLPTVWGEKVVARVLDSPVASLKLSDLSMLDRNMEVFSKSFSKPYGMILVTGPTGSGKSTTLYTTLATISKPSVNVITVEDPVEYRMPGINQVQVNAKAGLTFAAALRSILRSDPDVILLGEIRDEETAKIAIESSLTGHLVLSTLHTNDAPSAITRLTEMGVEPFLVGSALDAVVAQRLARRLCARCKSASVATDLDLMIFGISVDPVTGPPTVYKPEGCSQCSNTGYRGRIALHEVMAVDDEIERLAVANAPTADITARAEAAGMTRLRMDGWAKVLLGHTSIEEVLRVTV
ncbi:GspE/PulE family protein [Microbacterium sp. 179-B 1A2 NHS]|uniref:GspE/PulE family protein n=1 Tax=Microbacterium sp. 179-B 1A2 NHS TaxID=3142383 RepID=UPI0039A0BFD2